MKKYLIIILILVSTTTAYSQKIGYEFRTNGKAYISTSYAGFEIRHRTDREENRFTYRHKLIDSDIFGIPFKPNSVLTILSFKTPFLDKNSS